MALAFSAPAGAAFAQSDSVELVDLTLDGYAGRIAADEKVLAEQAKQIEAQRAELEAQRRELDELRARVADLGSVRAAGAPGGSDAPIVTAEAQSASDGGGATSAPVTQPVGEAPPAHPATLALPYGVNVLTPPGHLVWESGVDYQNSSTNRLVFEGVEISNALLIGVIQADETANNAVIGWQTLRYGVMPRFELEVAVPYVYRTARVTTVQTAQNQLSQTFNLAGSGIGDVQMTARYQLTAGRPDEPIIVANLEVKSDSGRGPYDVKFDAGGVAQTLAAGSGFWAIEPSISFLYPSDPVVLFGNLGYLHSFGYDINKDIGSAHIGVVQPGDGISAAIGFSFALNPHFSYSLGFKNDFFFGTSSVLTQLGGASPGGSIKAYTTNLEAGSLLLGGSYRLTPRLPVNVNFEFGVTADAPNVTVMLRLPYVF